VLKRFPFFDMQLQVGPAMLRFVCRWNLSNLRSIGERALQAIGEASATQGTRHTPLGVQNRA